MKSISSLLIFTTILVFSCNSKKQKEESLVPKEAKVEAVAKHIKPFNKDLPTIGLLIYDGVLITEVTATADVFSKPTKDKEQLFNVITVAGHKNPIVAEEGLTLIADYTFDECPELEALFIPSAYDMYSQVRDKNLIEFIRKKNKETKYTVSNCAGAKLVGVSGIAKGKKIVTYIGGGEQLQKDYPDLLVQDDAHTTFVEDGKFSSSNGNLASYISALNLVEKMTSKEHREFVESYLYLDRLQSWQQ
ncbi:DJ-1/PfpI family protein [Aquimarina spongiae]|uniref:DJ-1/PfpI family protein n=1 Tax=Aquimarina spongiae TaxID=570521 RepID=A0A1M6HFR3_9FLAO|nr:DJ-1/PfpI family protein [Aquimarina spongiae]SHJ20964.1 DJ-1/PfpI family protein [Aquimarina spongiae]